MINKKERFYRIACQFGDSQGYDFVFSLHNNYIQIHNKYSGVFVKVSKHVMDYVKKYDKYMTESSKEV